jgi:hypothetical protein
MLIVVFMAAKRFFELGTGLAKMLIVHPVGGNLEVLFTFFNRGFFRGAGEYKFSGHKTADKSQVQYQ